MTAVSYDNYTDHWVDIWKGGLQPRQRFDAGGCVPGFKALLDKLGPALEGKSALVPGCGRGYDVVELAQHGCTATGLEIAPAATEAAAKYADSCAMGAARPNAVFLTGDFFHHEHQYDYGYDYTFMCSFVPERRESWAAAWAKLIRPGGELITVMFPVGDVGMGPPPFQVKPEQYEELLTSNGFQKIVVEKLSDDMSHGPRAGKEWIGRWRKTASNL